jgi:UDP-2,4-diacetamido-2,4,6-trideoxy-beta-L-altropyranose hydrolase
MHIAFRVDSSTIIGYGHVMRCLTLAHALVCEVKSVQKESVDEDLLISFLCRDQLGHSNQLIEDAHFNLLPLPPIEQKIDPQNTDSWLGTGHEQDVLQCITQIKTSPPIDLLIVDHYAIDHHWHTLMKPYYQKLLVIDDLANRKLACDFLLDQTYNRDKESYQKLVSKHCQFLLGQNYILLRDEFSLLKTKAQRRRKERFNEEITALSSTNILISMGGTDPDNLSQLALFAVGELIAIRPNITVNLVISSQSIHLASLTLFCDQHPWANLIIDSKSMATLMLLAHVAIGASGGTAWERCCLGLPCLTIVNAENQQLIANNLAQAGAIINLGWYQDITTNTIVSGLNHLLNDTKSYQQMTYDCFNICEGQGAANVAGTVAKQLTPMPNKIEFQPLKADNCQLIYQWQSNKDIRKYARNPNPPSWEEHIEWFKSCLADPSRLLYLLADGQKNIVGLLRLDKLIEKTNARDTYEISILISPEHQGKGLATSALIKLKKLHKNATYIATIDKNNISSQKAFVKVGFKQVSSSFYQLKVINFQ